MPERDELDRLIDSELARYAEPRTGLEQRIKARVEAEVIRRPRNFGGWTRWGIAGALVIAAVLVVSVPRFILRETNVKTAHVTGPDHTPIANAGTTSPDVEPHVRRIPQMRKSTLGAARASRPTKEAENVGKPKLDIFPAPHPLSAQEQSLLELTTRLPKAERERLFSDHDKQDAPLEISSIKIPLITVPDLGKK